MPELRMVMQQHLQLREFGAADGRECLKAWMGERGWG